MLHVTTYSCEDVRGVVGRIVVILVVLAGSCCASCWMKRCLSDEKVFELDVLCFLCGSSSCEHVLPARRVCVDPDVGLLDVECFL